MTLKQLAEWHLKELRKHGIGEMANFHSEAIYLLAKINELQLRLKDI
jgi:hypothetical protein